MLIGTNEQLNKIDHCNIAIKVGKSQINPVKSVKDLGVIFDENFSFNDQINQLSKKSRYQLIKVKNIKKYMDKTTLEMVIHSLIFSNIDYCNEIFHNLPAYQFHNIQ